MSRGCLEADSCSGAERALSLVTAVGLLAMTAVVIALGWKGKLFGARRA
jgi:hypothetical protein